MVDLTRDDSCDRSIDVINSSQNNCVSKKICDINSIDAYSIELRCTKDTDLKRRSNKRAYEHNNSAREIHTKRSCLKKSQDLADSNFRVPSLGVSNNVIKKNISSTEHSFVKKSRRNSKPVQSTADNYLNEISRLSFPQKEALLAQYKRELQRLQAETDRHQSSDKSQTNNTSTKEVKNSRVANANKEWDIMPTPDNSKDRHGSRKVHIHDNRQ